MPLISDFGVHVHIYQKQARCATSTSSKRSHPRNNFGSSDCRGTLKGGVHEKTFQNLSRQARWLFLQLCFHKLGKYRLCKPNVEFDAYFLMPPFCLCLCHLRPDHRHHRQLASSILQFSSAACPPTGFPSPSPSPLPPSPPLNSFAIHRSAFCGWWSANALTFNAATR